VASTAAARLRRPPYLDVSSFENETNIVSLNFRKLCPFDAVSSPNEAEGRSDARNCFCHRYSDTFEGSAP
jgi:hypothetical protein